MTTPQSAAAPAGTVGAVVRLIMVCVPVEIKADNPSALDEACEDTAKRMSVDRWTWYKHGAAMVKSMPGAYWHEQPNARPVRTDGPPRDSGTHEAVVGRSEDA